MAEKQLEQRVFAGGNLRAVKSEAWPIWGTAAVFNSPSEDLGGFIEIIRAGAFANTIKTADIRALFNHDPDYVLGRRKSGTLKLEETLTGLMVRIKPPETGWANDLLVSIQRGDISGMSFGFRTIKDNWFTESGQTIRELLEVELYDVSVVTFPAYQATSVSAEAQTRAKNLTAGGDWRAKMAVYRKRLEEAERKG